MTDEEDSPGSRIKRVVMERALERDDAGLGLEFLLRRRGYDLGAHPDRPRTM
jgi:hypothetical protein